MKSPVYVAFAAMSGCHSDLAFLDAIDERIHAFGMEVCELFDDGDLMYAEAYYGGVLSNEALQRALDAAFGDFPLELGCTVGAEPFVGGLFGGSHEPTRTLN